MAADADAPIGGPVPLERAYDFDEMVDADGPVEIRGQPFVRSEILASDPIAYRDALTEYREEQLRDLLECGTERFPHPIAHCLYRYLNSAESENQRLQFLKDTWEALIAVMNALGIAEARSREVQLRVEGDKIRDFTRYLDSRNIRDRLEVLRVTVGKEPSLPLVGSIIDSETVDQMIALNQLRNEDLAHLATLNDRQSTELILKVEPELLGILRKARDLEAVELARFLGPGVRRGEYKLEIFRGHGSSRRIESRRLSAHQAATMGRQGSSDVLALFGDQALPLSPMIVWREGKGHRSELAHMKKRSVVDNRSVFTFEVFGDAEEFEDDSPALAEDLASIKRIYVQGKP